MEDGLIKVEELIKSYTEYYTEYITSTLPFDFEKRSKDNFASIIRTAWPTQELFVCIDDDLGKTGYSLISRGLYPDRISRKLLLTKEDKPNQLRKKIKNIIPKILRPFVLFFVGYIYRISYTLNIFWNK